MTLILCYSSSIVSHTWGWYVQLSSQSRLDCISCSVFLLYLQFRWSLIYSLYTSLIPASEWNSHRKLHLTLRCRICETAGGRHELNHKYEQYTAKTKNYWYPCKGKNNYIKYTGFNAPLLNFLFNHLHKVLT